MTSARLGIIAVLVSCSSRDREPSPTPTTGEPPQLSEAHKEDLVREVAKQASAGVDASTSACVVPATIDRANVTGTLTISTFGGKTTHNALGDLPGGVRVAVYAGTKLPAGRTVLRARREPRDFTRPIVVELVSEGRALDGMAGAIVIDKAAPDLVGHLEDVEFREQREDFAYVPDGCTSHVERIDFVFHKRAD